MTEDELSALRSWLRSFPFNGNMTCGQVSEAGEMCLRASEAIASLSASLANCERRAEEAESRNDFYRTVLDLPADDIAEIREALAKKVKK